MAHEIESFAYAKSLPWHELGTYLGDELVTSERMIQAAELDWTVHVNPNLFVSVGGDQHEVVTHHAVVRNTDQKILGIVGPRYRPVQNREVFDFAEAFAGEAGVRFETAGSLRGGRVVFALGKLQDRIKFFGNDYYDKYLLLTNAHDGSRSFTLKFTTVRVVCANTLAAALRSSDDEFRMRHVSNVSRLVQEARRASGIMDDAYKQLEDELDRLQNLPWNIERHERFCYGLLDQDPEDPSGRASTHVGYLTDAYLEGYGQSELPETRYRALQSVTQWVSHARSPRLTKKALREVPDKSRLQQEKKMESVLYGSGNDYAQKARRLLLADA